MHIWYKTESIITAPVSIVLMHLYMETGFKKSEAILPGR
jgi:hypothetical protein